MGNVLFLNVIFERSESSLTSSPLNVEMFASLKASQNNSVCADVLQPCDTVDLVPSSLTSGSVLLIGTLSTRGTGGTEAEDLVGSD